LELISLPHPYAAVLPRSPEEQDIPIRVANLEAAKTIVGILKRRAEGCSMIGKLGGERIRVWGIDVGSHLMEG
jgi:hypothetical protein